MELNNNIPDYLNSISINPKKQFEILDFIGEGTFGQVFKARHIKSGKIYSVKIIKNEKITAIEKLIIESSIQKLCKECDYINHYYGSYIDLETKDIWLILEYCKYGNVIDLIRKYNIKLQEKTISSIIKMLLLALQFLHNNSIIHRDIKGNNILLNEKGKIQLCDFGTSTMYISNRNLKKAGSTYWMSPEMCKGNEYNFPTDIWSLGITCIELAEGNPPYSDVKSLLAIKTIAKNPPQSLKNPNKFSKKFNHFISLCLKINPDERANINQLINHEFISDFNNDDNEEIMKEFIDMIESKKRLKEIVRTLDFGKNLDDDSSKFSSSKISTDIKRGLFNDNESRISKQSYFIDKDFENNKNNNLNDDENSVCCDSVIVKNDLDNSKDLNNQKLLVNEIISFEPDNILSEIENNENIHSPKKESSSTILQDKYNKIFISKEQTCFLQSLEYLTMKKNKNTNNINIKSNKSVKNETGNLKLSSLIFNLSKDSKDKENLLLTERNIKP